MTSMLAAVEPTRGRFEPGAEGRTSLWEFVLASGQRALVLGFSKDPNGKVTVLLVSDETGRPAMVVKAATTDPGARAVEAESQALETVQELELGSVRGTVPRVLGVVDFHGRPAAVMTAVPGVPLTTAYMSRGHTASPGRVE